MDRDLQEEEETGDTMPTLEESSTTNQRASKTPKKRKVRGGAEDKRTPAKNPKRKRMNANIKQYITCRKWREEEERMGNGQEQQEGEQQHHQDVDANQDAGQGEQVQGGGHPRGGHAEADQEDHPDQEHQEGDHQQHHPLDQEKE